MNRRRLKTSLLTLAFVLTICLTAKVTENAVRKDISAVAVATQVAEEAMAPDAVEQFRTEREMLRQMQKNQLNDIIHSDQSEQSIVNAAQEQLLRILDEESLEVLLEGILRMRGFDNTVVSVNNGSVNVLMGKEGIDASQTAMILDLITSETGISAGNVKIIPIN